MCEGDNSENLTKSNSSKRGADIPAALHLSLLVEEED
jgi:hypothetical protein